MINVLHVLSDSNIGGAGRHMAALVNSLDKTRFNVFVACPVGAQIISALDKDNVKVFEVESMDKDKSFNFKSIPELMSIIRRNKIQIVHTHASFSGRIAARLSGVKIVYTRHTPGTPYRRGTLKWYVNKLLNIFFANKVIAVSNYIRKQLIDYGIPENKVGVIYNGLDIQKFDEHIEKEEVKRVYGINDEFVVLEIARLEKGKGHEYLLEAAKLLKDDGVNFKMIFAGDGSRMEELQEISRKLDVQDKVIFTGLIMDIKQIIAISDAVALPSLWEALGIALIEGMCMGKPCIGTNVDGIPEVIQNNESGILVDPKNPQQLKDAILTLLDNEDLRIKMGQTGRQIAQEKFSLNKMINGVENLYSDLIS